MIPAPFDYQAPATLEEAVSLLASDLDGAKDSCRWTQSDSGDEAASRATAVARRHCTD